MRVKIWYLQWSNSLSQMVKEQQQQKQVNKTATWYYPTSIFIQEPQVQLTLQPSFVLDTRETENTDSKEPPS